MSHLDEKMEAFISRVFWLVLFGTGATAGVLAFFFFWVLVARLIMKFV